MRRYPTKDHNNKSLISIGIQRKSLMRVWKKCMNNARSEFFTRPNR
jgi:hypothetical protein